MSVERHHFADESSRSHQITIDISPELERQIEMLASNHHLSTREYITYLLESTILSFDETAVEDPQTVTLQAIDRLNKIREKILQERQGEPFDDSAELIRTMRAERTDYLHHG